MKNYSKNPSLPWTGERYVPEVRGQIELEHVHRYAFASQFVDSLDVLDIACGEGYGSALLARTANRVIGVDISEDVIKHASHRYGGDNLSFIQGSCTAIPLPDSSVDIVVSFETIEHHQEHDLMMREVSRVLRPEGIFVISSPEKKEYSDVTGQNNPFHVKELYRHEFELLISKFFYYFGYFGQRIAYGSAILSESLPGASTSLNINQPYQIPSKGIERPQYLIAVASNAQLPTVFSSFCEQPINETEYAQGWSTLVGERETQVARLSEMVNERDVQIAELSDEVVRHEAWTLDLNAQLEQVTRTLEELRGSTSWRITSPLRVLGRAIPIGTHLRLRSGAAVLNVLKHVYHRLPVKSHIKQRIKSIAYRKLSRIFSQLPSYKIWENQQRHLLRMTAPVVHSGIVYPDSLQDDELANFSLAVATNPLVSVVIPVYGKSDFTLRCLKSIQRNAPRLPFEVIVVDDCSPDDTLSVLAKVRGVCLVSNEINQGFIRSCNRGAKQAKGEFICFLNNDTEVMPNWLDELIGTFELFENVGLVGSKLIYPDGCLQEAGGIIWRDGSAWNYGRFEDPALPQYNYAREVDYCSGASILLKRALFNEFGGFDERYLPAYGEDSDLALKVRTSGFKVIYQPLSQVIHHEGISSGADTSTGIKSYQLINAKKLFDRWKDTLKSNQFPGDDVDRAKDRGVIGRVLVLDHCTPTPDQDAGSVTAMNLMLMLRQAGFAVTFIPEDNFFYMPEYTQTLQRCGIEVLYAPYVASVEQHLKLFGQRYDLVLIFRPTVAKRHLQLVKDRCHNAKLLYHTSDVHFLRMEREADLTSDQRLKIAAAEMKVLELAVMSEADSIIVHSSAEQKLLSCLMPTAQINVFQWAIPVIGTGAQHSSRRDIAFVGGYQHQPNVDAVLYFVENVFPLIQKLIPNVRFWAIGSNPPPEILRLSSKSIVVTGFVNDLSDVLDNIKVAVAPLRYGAGVKGKIATTLSLGLPCVASTIAAEGMGLQDQQNILIADQPDEFAAAVLRLYNDKGLWDRISENGIRFSENTYGVAAAEKTMQHVLEGLGFFALSQDLSST